MSELADIIRQARTARAWPQEQLAEAAGVSLRTVQRVERGDACAKETARRVRLLAGCRIFEEVEPADLAVLAGMLTPRSLARGAWLCREGEPAREAWLVESGTLSVERQGHRLATLTTGELTGEYGLFHDRSRTADFVALEDCALARAGIRPSRTVPDRLSAGRAGPAPLGYRARGRRCGAMTTLPPAMPIARPAPPEPTPLPAFPVVRTRSCCAFRATAVS